MKRYIYKSAEDGLIVTKAFAEANPTTTYKTEITNPSTELNINLFTLESHQASVQAGWWDGVDIVENEFVVPGKIALIHSELSEALEGHRKDMMDDKLPYRKMVEVELADAMIRIADLAGALGLDLGGAVVEKMAFNASRADHKPENREKQHGKKY